MIHSSLCCLFPSCVFLHTSELVEEAQDSLELDESYIIHQLTTELPDNYELAEKYVIN